MKKSESSKRKHNTDISANLANFLTTVGSILEFLNLENELRDACMNRKQCNKMAKSSAI